MLLIATLACGVTPLQRAALTQDLPTFRAAAEAAARRGAMSERNARALARAVLRRELFTRDVVADDRSFGGRACMRRMGDALRELARDADEQAAHATFSLIDAGLVAPAEPGDFGAADHAMVQARRTVGVRAGARRRSYLRHGDRRVRRAALRAALDSQDVGDVSALLEAARLDPDPSSRRLAIRVLGTLGGAETVLSLRDLWGPATEELRLAIVAAWSAAPTIEQGGERELLHAAESGEGLVAVSAAAALVRSGRGPSGLAEGVLQRAIAGQDLRTRLWALDQVPLTPVIATAVREASRSPNPETQTLALARMARQAPLDAASITALRALALDGSQPTAVVALSVLSAAGDASVVPALRRDLGAARAHERSLAARALIAARDWNGAVPALADDSPRVRRRVACRMLVPAVAGHPAVIGGSLVPLFGFQTSLR